MAILLGHVFADADKEPTVFCIPGDTIGILYAMKDIETIYFVRQTGEVGRLVRSVCTGTLLLGQAGLTCGYRVTSCWVTKPLREAFDAIPVDERVVEDRNRSTRAGVTAGIDFGLMLLAKMRDEDDAKSVQLLAEYDSQPPFDAGTSEEAPEHLTGLLQSMVSEMEDTVSTIVVTRQQWSLERRSVS